MYVCRIENIKATMVPPQKIHPIYNKTKIILEVTKLRLNCRGHKEEENEKHSENADFNLFCSLF